MSSENTAADVEFPYRDKIEEARRFLAERGITDVRPVYGPDPLAQRRRSSIDSANAGTLEPVVRAPSGAAEKARRRWFATQLAEPDAAP